MNREEIEWITRNLFIGNKLWSGEVRDGTGKAFDLREIRSPIILFASMGDNITPPQQAFNWVADIYGSTEEIKSRGQVIIGLMEEDVGHLGIFVSGKVAKKEHAQIVSVLDAVETLPPGLYAMSIEEVKGADGKSLTRSRSPSTVSKRSRNTSTASGARTNRRSRRSPSCPNSRSAPMNCSCSRSCSKPRTKPRRARCGNFIRCAFSAGRFRT